MTSTARRTVVLLVVLAAAAWAGNASAGIFVVDQAGDGPGTCGPVPTGSCTLRSAINAVNVDTDPSSVIQFRIGTGQQTIGVTGGGLPVITQTHPVLIDGQSQPFWSSGGGPVIELDGSATSPGSVGIYITGGHTTVRGLSIVGFDFDGIRIESGGNNVITGNWIGVNLAGLAQGNHGLGILIRGPAPGVGPPSTGNVIGGSNQDDRNVVSANGFGSVGAPGPYPGVGVYDNSTATIDGNYVGTDAAGSDSAGFGNNLSGVWVESTSNVTVGEPGAGNVISGNSTNVVISTASTNTVQANKIGTDKDGLNSLGDQVGVLIQGTSSGNMIGGTFATDGNLFGGDVDGVQISGSDGNLVKGNRFGVDVQDGALSNDIAVDIEAGNANVVGQAPLDPAEAANFISGSFDTGVFIRTGDGNQVFGNDIRGGSTGIGLGTGVETASNNQFADNTITGASALGIAVNVGTGTEVTGNRVTGSGEAGVAVLGTATATISQNSLEDNSGLGIDLGNDGSTPNDAGDPDTGPNGLQNRPDITSTALKPDGTIDVVGTFNSAPNVATPGYTFEFFESKTCSNVNPQGATYVGTLNNVSTDGSGDANWSFNVPGGDGGFITVTATDPATGATSEFSDCAGITGTTFIVDRADDVGGLACDDSTPNDCDLRSAIEHANLFGSSEISFSIGFGDQVIAPTLGDLPALNGQTVIDATTQPGYTGTPIIELDGSASGSAIGLQLGDSVTVRGIAFERWPTAGVMATGTGDVLEGNYVGVDSTGTTAAMNAIGVFANGSHNLLVGGGSAGARNVISGNGDGISIGGNAVTTTIRGNYIGTTADGSFALPNVEGIVVTNSSSTIIGGNAALYRNVISGNNNDGILTGSGVTSAKVEGNYIGTDPTGTQNLGNEQNGIRLGGGGMGVGSPIPGGGNVISGNTFSGIAVNAAGNTIRANYIGTTASGRAALGNLGAGITVATASAGNSVIGGTGAGYGNVISGNRTAIHIVAPADAVQVLGNRIGTDPTGTQPIPLLVPPGRTGIDIDGSSANEIGDGTPGGRNLISGNNLDASSGSGIYIHGATATGNFIRGNYIGTDIFGTTGISDHQVGIVVDNTVPNTVIGGTTAGEGNLISGNNSGIYNSGDNTKIQGNLVGTDKTGLRDVGNTDAGIREFGTNTRIGGTTLTTPGGACTGACNVFSGNDDQGIDVEFATAAGAPVIQGNFIGVGIDGLTPVPNHIPSGQGTGIDLVFSNGVQIGGGTAAARNVIGANDTGILVDSGDSNVIQGNYIGLGTDGNTAVGARLTPNPLDGVGIDVTDGATNTTIEGVTTGAGNVISGNGQYGIHVHGADTTTIKGNLIGTNAAGTLARPNGAHGILVEDTSPAAKSSNTAIGGLTAIPGVTPGNVISGNAHHGVIDTSTGGGDLFQGNLVGTNAAGTAALGNGQEGIEIQNDGTVVGGVNPAARNVASGNGGSGILLLGASHTTVDGNYAGTNAAGTAAIPNGFDGIGANGSHDSQIGTPGGGNLVSGNNLNGVAVFNGSDLSFVQANRIGVAADGTSPLGNGGEGVRVLGTSNVTVGGASAPNGNTIANNGTVGVNVIGNPVTGVSIESNSIYANGGLGIDLGNDGVTPNDPPTNLDADAGPNGLQNFPVVSAAQMTNPNHTDVTATLDSAGGGSYTVDWYRSATCDPSGNGEGRDLVGSTTVSAGANGHGDASTTLTSSLINGGDVLTATATDNVSGSTSEFSPCQTVLAAVSASLSLGTTTPNVTAGAQTVPLSGINLSDLTQGNGTTAGAALGGIPIDRMALGGIALGGIALGGIGITPQLLDSTLGGVHLADVPLERAGGWPAYVQANIPSLAGAPLDSLTLSQVLPSIPATGVNAVHLADLDLSRTALGGIALGGIALGPLQLSQVPLHANSTGAAQNLADWCTAINGVPGFSCSGGVQTVAGGTVSLANETVMSEALRGLPLDQIGLEGAPLAGVTTNGTHVGGIALGGIALGGIALGGIDLHGTALGGIALGGIYLQGSALGGIALGGIPLTGTALGGIALGGINLNSTALGGIALGGIALGGINLDSTALGGIALGGIALGGIDIQNSALGGIALGGIALGGIDLTSSALGGIALGGIATNNPVVDCSGGYCTNAHTLADAQRAGRIKSGATLGGLVDTFPSSTYSNFTLDHLGGYGSVTLSQLIAAITDPNARAQWNAVTLEALIAAITDPNAHSQWNAVTIAALIAALNDPNSLNLAQLVSSLGNNTSLTLNDLLAVLPPGFTLHDLLAVILGAAGYDWSNLNLGTFPLASFSSDGGTITYQVHYTVTGGPANPAYTVHATLPTGGEYVPHSSKRCVGASCTPAAIGDPVISGNQLSWTGNALLTQPYTLEWKVAAPLNLGSYSADANIVVNGLASAVVATPVDVNVGQTYDSDPSTPADDQNNNPATAPQLSGGNLYVSQLIRGDTDYYRIPIGPFGSRVDLTLSHIPSGSDYDLTVAGPPAPRLRGAALGGIPLTNSQLPDTAPQLDQQTQSLPPETMQDIPSSALTANGNVIRGVSDNRGNAAEHITLISEGETGFYVVQVSNYTGTDATQPYVLEVESSSPPNLGTCNPRTGMTNTTATAPAPSITASTNTLFLVDEARLRSTYSATAVDNLLAKVNALAGRADLGVNGAVVHVESGTGVPAAYTAWDSAPCDPQRANAVVTAIGHYLDTLEASAPNLQNLVVVGGDDIIPFGRVPDETQIANERGYADSLIGPGNTNNEYRGSTGEGFLLTDDVWGEKGAPDFLGHELFIPEIATGRLVESPADMSKAIDGFTSASGRLTPTSSLVTGYDFLSDGATQVNVPFNAAFGSGAQTLINESWTRSQLLSLWFPGAGGPTLDSINAHFDHHRLLPASENAGGTQISANLVTTADVPANAMAGRLGFSMGCHAGLPVSDAIFGAANLLASDWAQAMLGNGAFGWIANTSYGLGDTTEVAYSERLDALFSRKLDGSVTLGQALALAKQDYIGTLGIVSPYDAKVTMEATLYGLPMLRIGAGHPDRAAASAAAPHRPGDEPPGRLVRRVPDVHARGRRDDGERHLLQRPTTASSRRRAGRSSRSSRAT